MDYYFNTIKLNFKFAYKLFNFFIKNDFLGILINQFNVISFHSTIILENVGIMLIISYFHF